MATETVHRDEAADQQPLEPFKSFQWHNRALDAHGVKLPANAVMRLMGLARDVTFGGLSLLELLEWDDLREAADETKMLPAAHRSDLTRLLIASLTLLGQDVEKHMAWAYDYHTAEGIAERRARKAY